MMFNFHELVCMSAILGCGSGTVCYRGQKDLAFCDVCDFDPYTYMCGSVTGHYSTVPTPAPPHPADNCVTDEERIYSGLDLDFPGKLCEIFDF